MTTPSENARICNVCGIRLKTPFEKFDHLKKTHLGEIGNVTRKRIIDKKGITRTWYYCPDCDTRLSNLTAMLRHVSHHKEQLPEAAVVANISTNNLAEALEFFTKFSNAFEIIVHYIETTRADRERILKEKQKLQGRIVDIQNLLAKPD